MPEQAMPVKRYEFELARAENLNEELRRQVGKSEGLVLLKKSYNPHLQIVPINIKDNDFIGYLIKESGASNDELNNAFRSPR